MFRLFRDCRRRRSLRDGDRQGRRKAESPTAHYGTARTRALSPAPASVHKDFSALHEGDKIDATVDVQGLDYSLSDIHTRLASPLWFMSHDRWRAWHWRTTSMSIHGGPDVRLGYVRVSTDRQAERGVSLEAQEAKIRAMATVQGADLIEVVVDGGESAKSLKRPGLQRIMTLVNSGKVQAVIVAVS